MGLGVEVEENGVKPNTPARGDCISYTARFQRA